MQNDTVLSRLILIGYQVTKQNIQLQKKACDFFCANDHSHITILMLTTAKYHGQFNSTKNMCFPHLIMIAPSIPAKKCKPMKHSTEE